MENEDLGVGREGKRGSRLPELLTFHFQRPALLRLSTPLFIEKPTRTVAS